MRNILLVEDDEALIRGISFKLKKEGYNVFSAKSIKEAECIFTENNINLIILDIGLPDGSGFDFCTEVRKTSDVLIIFLTACDEEFNIVTGLDIGGDDYITKPFSLMVLMSKINALLRRGSKKDSESVIETGDIVFYPQNMMIVKDGTEIPLSKTEFKLINYFIANANQVITKEQLLDQLWDIDGNFIDKNTIAVNIRRLREKIEDDPSKPVYIKNVRGIGYIWSERCISR